jgi:hypothetical protein
MYYLPRISHGSRLQPLKSPPTPKSAPPPKTLRPPKTPLLEVEAVAAEGVERPWVAVGPRELEVAQEVVAVTEEEVDVAVSCKEPLATRMTTTRIVLLTPFPFGDPAARPNPVRKSYMKPMLPRRKMIRTQYRELVSGGELKRRNCLLLSHIDASR